MMLSPQAQLDRSRLAGVVHLPVLAQAEGLSGTASRARALLAANTPLPLARGLTEFVEPLERAARLVAPQSGVPLTAWRRAMETLRVQPSPSAP